MAQSDSSFFILHFSFPTLAHWHIFKLAHPFFILHLYLITAHKGEVTINMVLFEIVKNYLPQIVVSAIIVLLTPSSKFVIAKIVRKYSAVTLKSENRTLHIIRVINILINLSCIIILGIVWGVQPQNMLVAVSSIFAVIGVALFAQWSILSNITAGIIIFFTTPFRIGDEIHILDKDTPIDATIENILTFHTHLRTKDNELIIIANSLFMQKIVSVGKSKQC